ncbi:MAG: Glycerol-3-phosphate cytidylyltransferase [bacterium ADurb.Bin212]|nr:MAG: Glycerol-3-phosphate cytidylyltransferase [bacterium ADurb.Bin212]
MKKKIIGYTTGVFDLFHVGHLNIIKNAKSMCDYLIVGVTSDQLCLELKNKKPVIPFEERAEIIRSLKYVDEVVCQNVVDEIADHQKYGYDIIFKGSDWMNSEKWRILSKEIEKRGAIVKFFPYTKNTSSTIIKKYLMNG